MADAQNPWFTDSVPASSTPPPGSTVGQPAPGYGPGATILSEGPDWLKPENQAPKNLSDYLDANKWQEWGDDEWRAATGGYGFEGGLMGQLQALMGEGALKNQIQTYGVGGSRYAPGRYDFATKKMVYDDVPQAALAAANSAAKWGGKDMSNPGGTGTWADMSNPIYAALKGGSITSRTPSTSGPAPINYSGSLGTTATPHDRGMFVPQQPVAMPKPQVSVPQAAPVASAPRASGGPAPAGGQVPVYPTATQLRRNMLYP